METDDVLKIGNAKIQVTHRLVWTFTTELRRQPDRDQSSRTTIKRDPLGAQYGTARQRVVSLRLQTLPEGGVRGGDRMAETSFSPSSASSGHHRSTFQHLLGTRCRHHGTIPSCLIEGDSRSDLAPAALSCRKNGAQEHTFQRVRNEGEHVSVAACRGYEEGT